MDAFQFLHRRPPLFHLICVTVFHPRPPIQPSLRHSRVTGGRLFAVQKERAHACGSLTLGTVGSCREWGGGVSLGDLGTLNLVLCGRRRATAPLSPAWWELATTA